MFSREAGQNIWYDAQKVSGVARGSSGTEHRVRQRHV